MDIAVLWILMDSGKNMLERDIEKLFVATVKRMGGIAIKFTSPSRRAVPDRLVLMPGKPAWFCELKAPGKLPTPAQDREHRLLRELGQRVEVVDSLERIAEVLC